MSLKKVHILLLLLLLSTHLRAQRSDTTFFEIKQIIDKEVDLHNAQVKDSNFVKRFNYDTLYEGKKITSNRYINSHWGKTNKLMRQLKGKDFPDIYFESFEGQAKALSDYKADLTCLIFNYAFCQSCLNATDKLLDSLKQFRAKHTIQLITLFSDSKEDVEPFYENYNTKSAIGLISKEQQDDHLPKGIGTPYLFILDRNRKIVGSFYLNFIQESTTLGARLKAALEPE